MGGGNSRSKCELSSRNPQSTIRRIICVRDFLSWFCCAYMKWYDGTVGLNGNARRRKPRWREVRELPRSRRSIIIENDIIRLVSELHMLCGCGDVGTWVGKVIANDGPLSHQRMSQCANKVVSVRC